VRQRAALAWGKGAEQQLLPGCIEIFWSCVGWLAGASRMYMYMQSSSRAVYTRAYTLSGPTSPSHGTTKQLSAKLIDACHLSLVTSSPSSYLLCALLSFFSQPCIEAAFKKVYMKQKCAAYFKSSFVLRFRFHRSRSATDAKPRMHIQVSEIACYTHYKGSLKLVLSYGRCLQRNGMMSTAVHSQRSGDQRRWRPRGKLLPEVLIHVCCTMTH